MKVFNYYTSVRLQRANGTLRSYGEMTNQLGKRLREKFPALQKTVDTPNWTGLAPGLLDARLVKCTRSVYFIDEQEKYRIDLVYEMTSYEEEPEKVRESI